jgi:hypothetical protein
MIGFHIRRSKLPCFRVYGSRI